jgi:AcrR family transcriptional regulator
MARPTRITDEQILGAAREAFLEKGIRATTADVARRAEIAEGSIFKRFKSKEELFIRAMEATGEEPKWLATLGERAGADDVPAMLAELGLEIIEFFRSITPTLMMTWSNPRAGSDRPNPAPLMALKRVAAFFEAEMRAGKLKRQDADVLARCFLGSLQSYVFFETWSKTGSPSARKYVQGLASVFWEGLKPGGKRK